MKNMGTFLKRVIIITLLTVTIPLFSKAINNGEISAENTLIEEDKNENYNITFFENEMISKGNNIEETITETKEETPYENTPLPYPEEIENNSGEILRINFGRQKGDDFFSLNGGAQVRNITDVKNNYLMKESLILPEFKMICDGRKEVLIMHTHTTESYEPYSRDFYDDSFISRTTDERYNVVAVGEKITEELEKAGIGVIHDKTIHDYPSYNGSYDRSRVTVENILKQNPDIKIVLDIHRDAIERDGGVRVAPVYEKDGETAAQVMIISGCNYEGYDKNFRLACLIQRNIYDDYKGFCRPILFTYKNYNQDLTDGSLLIEIGGHANSVEEAEKAGEFLGKSLVSAFYEIKE